MHNKSKKIEEYRKKLEILKKYKHYYFNEDNPKITDSEYDSLKKEILTLEKNFSFLKNLNMASKIVGAKPINKFKKIKCQRKY